MRSEIGQRKLHIFALSLLINKGLKKQVLFCYLVLCILITTLQCKEMSK